MVAFRPAGVLLALILSFAAASGPAKAQGILSVTPPEQALGFRIGDDYMLANYTEMLGYWQRLDTESDRMTLVDMGPTAEGRRQVMAVVSAPENLARLDHYKDIARRLALGEDLTEAEAGRLSREGKAVIWIDGGLHANETVGSQQLIEMVYKMVSSTDPEIVRLLADTIQLYVPANPDGMELVAGWYMREPDPKKRSLAGLPRLYHKYIGHDDNRDFFLSSQPETTNMNRVMFQEWFPQIVYNHHQSGPAGTVVFIPPFRDPFNYNMHPLVPLGIEAVGAAMHMRLLSEGKGGSVMRGAAGYSTWWNGGLRTISYFHNMIGILTEIVGSPTPMDVPLVPDRQLPLGDAPLPIAPGRWHFRQSIDYELTQNLAVLDYASRNRETLLYNMYRMARDSIEAGNRDNWTITPRRVDALKAAAAARGNANRAPAELYGTILRDPKFRDPRGYIIPADQADFLTAIKFVNALLKTGVTVHRATEAFAIGGKTYPAGSFVVRTAQAFRAHVLDMFEPQDHPNDFQYPGGPPVPPYDITGWTLAMQMGVKFDRILDAFEGPLAKVTRLLSPPAATISDLDNAAGYCMGHRTNDSFVAVNRLLAAGRDVWWMQASQEFCTAAAPATRQILARVAAEIGVEVRAVAAAPSGAAFKLKPVRIGLYDTYGGLAPSGWTRWLLEQFEFPYSVIYPADLDSGDLRERFDVLLFTDEAFRVEGNAMPQPRAETIPAEYRARLGRITQENTLPRLRKFAEAGGAILAIGSSTSMAALLGIPAINHLTEETADGSRRALARADFYVPGSLLRVKVDTSHPLAHGMPEDAIVVFDSSPVFRIDPAAARRVAWYAGPETLASGWAWGQKYLDGGLAVAEVPMGAGKVILYGPEVAFRAQPHGTFKLLFNGLLYGAAEALVLP